MKAALALVPSLPPDLAARLDLAQEAAFVAVRRADLHAEEQGAPTNLEIAAAWAVACAALAPGGTFPGRTWHLEAALDGRVEREDATEITCMAEVIYDAIGQAAR